MRTYSNRGVAPARNEGGPTGWRAERASTSNSISPQKATKPTQDNTLNLFDPDFVDPDDPFAPPMTAVIAVNSTLRDTLLTAAREALEWIAPSDLTNRHIWADRIAHSLDARGELRLFGGLRGVLEALDDLAKEAFLAKALAGLYGHRLDWTGMYRGRR